MPLSLANIVITAVQCALHLDPVVFHRISNFSYYTNEYRHGSKTYKKKIIETRREKERKVVGIGVERTRREVQWARLQEQ